MPVKTKPSNTKLRSAAVERSARGEIEQVDLGVARRETVEASVTISQIESHLWEAANILRGPVDAADFKTYVFPLWFFKRISDVHDEEHSAALLEFQGDEEAALFPENYRFQIPDGCHWQDVRAVPSNVGQALQTAMRGIEQANPHTLYGIFGAAQWSNKDRLPDALLKNLIEHFSSLPLGNKSAQSDLLGQAYEYLIKKFADATNKKAGEFYTPQNKVLIVDALKEFKTGRAQNELLPEHAERIYGWVRDYIDVEGIARLVTLDEIASNDHNLNIPRYVEPKVTCEVLTVEDAMKRLRESAEAAFAAEERLVGILKKEGLLA